MLSLLPSCSYSVKIRYTGHDKDCLTAMLCINDAGQWCPGMILVKLMRPIKKAD